MKIADVKIGEEYAIKASRSDDPRRGTALAVEPITDPRGRYDRTRNIWAPTTTRQIKIEFQDEPKLPGWGGVDGAARGASLHVEPRNLLAPWREVAPAIREKAERQEFERGERLRIVGRLKALGVRGIDEHDYYHAQVNLGKRKRAGGFHSHVEVKLEGADLERVLALAEAGLIAQVTAEELAERRNDTRAGARS